MSTISLQQILSEMDEEMDRSWYSYLLDGCGKAEELVRLAWRANIAAKEEDEAWYDLKSTALERAVDWITWGDHEGILAWGAADGILYFDVTGYGQVSFHLVSSWWQPDEWWEKYDIPQYPYPWTGVPNEEFVFRYNSVPEMDEKLSAGEHHNLLVRGGRLPQLA